LDVYQQTATTQNASHVAQQLSQLDVSYVPVLSELLKVAKSARDLGVVIDSQLSSQLTSSCYADHGSTIAMIRPVAWSLSTEAAKTL